MTETLCYSLSRCNHMIKLHSYLVARAQSSPLEDPRQSAVCEICDGQSFTVV